MSLTDSMEELCSLIEHTLYAEQIKTVLAEHPDTNSVLVLPMWAWVRPEANLGHKGARAGEGALFPVRVHWDGPLVQPWDAAESTLDWRIDGLGVTAEGTQKIPAEDSSIPFQAKQPQVVDQDTLRTMLSDGEAARWQFLQLLELIVGSALERQHIVLMREYSTLAHGDPTVSNAPILHEEALEALRMRLVYGDNDDEGESLMMGVIRSSHTQSFAKVEPQRWLRVYVSKIARDKIRREIGDPEAGPLVRRTARAIGTEDPEQIAAALDGIGVKRVKDALDFAPHPDALAVRLQFYAGDEGDDWLHSQLAR